MAEDSFDRAKEILRQMRSTAAQDKAQIEKERRDLVVSVGKNIVDALKPLFEKIAENSRMNKQDFESAVSKIQVTTNTPDVTVPEIRVPTPQVTVKPPIVNVPDIVMPDEMNVRGWVQLQGVDLNNPLPVQLRDGDGNPVKLFENLTQLVSGGGGNSARIVKVGNADGDPVPVSIQSGSSAGTEYTEGDTDSSITGTAILGEADSNTLYAARLGAGHDSSQAIRVTHATDAIVSVAIQSGSSAGTEYADGATASPSTGTLAMGDTGEESGNIFALATASGVTGSSVLRVVHAADVGVSTNVTNTVTVDGSGVTQPVSATQLDVDDLNPTDDGVRVYQVSGNNWSTNVTNTVTVDATSSGDVPITLDGETVTVTATNLDVQSGGADLATSSQGSAIQTAVEIMDDWDATHDSAASSDGAQVMAEARTTNPTAVGNGDAVRMMADDVGRQVIRPVQVRDLTQTAYATISSDATTTLLAGASSTFHDLVYVMGANQSDGAVTLDFAAATNGGNVFSLEIPANSTAGVAPSVPIPQDVAADTWVMKFADSDVTGTTVDVSALFSKEV